MKRMNSREAGFSLIEVLVALLILGIGMLGMAKVLMVSMKSNGTAYSRTQAMGQASAMLDRIRANRATALTGTASNYNLPTFTSSATYGAGPNCLTAACSNATMASYEVATWLAGLSASNGLPSGMGSISFTTSAANEVSVQIQVQWDDSIAQKALKETATPATVTMTSVL